MVDAILVAIAGAIGVAVLGWLWVVVRNIRDRRRVYRWLQSNTTNAAGRTHVDTVTIAKGARLPVDRVEQACMTDKRIYRSSAPTVVRWSIWQEHPEPFVMVLGRK